MAGADASEDVDRTERAGSEYVRAETTEGAAVAIVPTASDIGLTDAPPISRATTALAPFASPDLAPSALVPGGYRCRQSTVLALAMQQRRFTRYGDRVVANMRGDLPLTVTVDDRPSEAHGSYSWSGGGMVLTLSSVLPDRGLAVELISTYVGHPNTHTIATHLMLGPVDHPAEIHTTEHEHLNPAER